MADSPNESNSSRTRDRVAKRTSNACIRCRRQKTKCSGSRPCNNCSKRHLACEFDQRDQKVIVTRGYILDLQQSIQESQLEARRRSAQRASPESSSAFQTSTANDGIPGVGGPGHREDDRAAAAHAITHITPRSDDADPRPVTRRRRQQDPIESASSGIENPLSLRHSEFVTSSSGNTFYLGTSSNWSFTRRILLLTHEHVCKTPLPTQTLLFDGAVHDIDWDGIRRAPDQSSPRVLPTLDHAIYLINSVKFNCGQLFHLFDEEEFMQSCHGFYAAPTPDVSAAGPWYVHFCLVVALGKALLSRPQRSKLPFGHEFFFAALKRLPSSGVHIKDPLVSIEILCCAALYLQCIDHRHYANILIGEALRTALCQGLHTDWQPQHLGRRHVERCRRVWWTVYILDREMNSLMGLPSTIHDDDVTCPLPSFAGSEQRVATFAMQVKLCGILANINKRLYGSGGNLHCNYLARAKEVLEDIANVADELRTSFPLQPSETLTGISRAAAHLHLLHHRCIVLVTRPLLFHLLKLRLTSPHDYQASLEPMQTVRNLIHMCIDSSQQMITILNYLQTQGILATFIPYDLEAVFVSTTNLLLGPVVDSLYSSGSRAWLRRAYDIFDVMIGSGNLVAEFRKAELQRLDEILGQLNTEAAQQGAASDVVTGAAGAAGAETLAAAAAAEAAEAAEARGSATPNPSSITAVDQRISRSIEAEAGNNGEVVETAPSYLDTESLGPDVFDSGFTGEQIMDIVEAIDDEDLSWMCDTIMEHSAW